MEKPLFVSYGWFHDMESVYIILCITQEKPFIQRWGHEVQKHASVWTMLAGLISLKEWFKNGSRMVHWFYCGTRLPGAMNYMLNIPLKSRFWWKTLQCLHHAGNIQVRMNDRRFDRVSHVWALDVSTSGPIARDKGLPNAGQVLWPHASADASIQSAGSNIATIQQRRGIKRLDT